MRAVGWRGRLRRAFVEEAGFTLSEMTVTIMIMVIVLFALYGIFDMSIRVFSYGNDKIEVTENARVALERMEREIRQAYPNSPTSTNVFSASSTNATQITFYNDLDGNGRGDGSSETISYYVDGNGNLMRSQSGTTAAPLTALGPGGSIEFKYFHKTTGMEITSPAANEANVGMVRIKLVVRQQSVGQDPQQELITNVALRNRSA